MENWFFWISLVVSYEIKITDTYLTALKLLFFFFLKNKGSLQFEDKWDFMRPIVLKLLRQESVTKQQWFDLFS